MTRPVAAGRGIGRDLGHDGSGRPLRLPHRPHHRAWPPSADRAADRRVPALAQRGDVPGYLDGGQPLTGCSASRRAVDAEIAWEAHIGGFLVGFFGIARLRPLETAIDERKSPSKSCILSTKSARQDWSLDRRGWSAGRPRAGRNACCSKALRSLRGGIGLCGIDIRCRRGVGRPRGRRFVSRINAAIGPSEAGRRSRRAPRLQEARRAGLRHRRASRRRPRPKRGSA